MDDFLQRRPVLLVIALVLAFAVWVSVTNQTNPIVVRSFTGVAVQAEGSAPSKVAIFPKRVTVTVEGPESVIRELEVSSLSVRASTLGDGTGSRKVPLTLTAPPGVGLVGITPTRATVIQGP